MTQLHKLLSEHGKQGVLELGLYNRAVVESAATYMAVEESDIGFLYSGFAQAALPHRRLKDDATWQVRTDYATLLIQPGLRATRVGDPVPVGVPFGSRARLICLYLQSTALRTRSREVELGRSLHDWLKRMNIPVGGKSMQQVRDQAERIARCRMSFEVQQGGRTGLVNQSIMDDAIFLNEDQDGKSTGFLERACLSESFYRQLQRHPVPIEEAAIFSLSNNSMAMDVYCWLAYRLHSLRPDKSTPISWKALHLQFGTAFGQLKDFRPTFRSNLSLALSVYPGAKVEEDGRGLQLHHSRPPIAPKVVSIKLGRVVE